MLTLHEGALDPKKIYTSWYDTYKDENFGALITFTGVVREEDGIEALSFDIYEPILYEWFDKWQEKASKEGAKVLMAHSIGDVAIHECSYIASVVSPQRKIALKLIVDFVEDFKASAPIWKYDVKSGCREYALERSSFLHGAGVLNKG